MPISKVGEYIRPDPKLALKILRLYSRELRTIQQHLARLDQRSDRDAIPERLYLMAERYRRLGKTNHVAHVLNAYIEWAQRNSGEHLEEAKKEFEEVRSAYHELAFGGRATRVGADTMLFAEGETGQDIYVVIEGAVKLVRYSRGSEFVIDVLGAGELFGEMALIEQAPRMGSAITIQDSQIMRISPDQLVASVAANVLQKIFESMARRIWFAHQRLIVFKIGDPLMRMYAYLYNLTRNQNLRAKEKNPADRSYRFEITLSQLQALCGILQLKEASVAELMANENLIIEENAITVKSRKRLADHISFFRAKTGQIVAETN